MIYELRIIRDVSAVMLWAFAVMGAPAGMVIAFVFALLTVWLDGQFRAAMVGPEGW